MEKTIHCCWFGGKKIPKNVQKCIKTWEKWLPDYKIKYWNESNFDINICPFVKEAYENKKWAFVSDYVRIYALYNEGGIYFDTDMKVIKDISDITKCDMFIGYEDTGYFGTAVIGVKEKNNKYIKEILDYYNKIEHFNPEIIYTYANPVIITKMVKKYASYVNEQGIEIFDNNIYAYPRDYFYPLSYDYSEKIYTQNTRMIHLFNATWTDKTDRRIVTINRKLGPKLGRITNKIIDKCGNLIRRIGNKFKKIYHYLKKRYYIYAYRAKRVKNIQEQIKKIEKNYITVCHPNKLQDNSIETLFKGSILKVEEQYTEKEAKQIARIIADSEKKIIIFNSCEKGWNIIISELKNLNKDIIIKVLIHGGNSLLIDENNFNSFNDILDLYTKQNINELGFFNKSLYEFYKQKGYNVNFLMKYVEIENKEKYTLKKQEKDVLRIGMYKSYDNIVKNIFNQLSAVSLLNNTILDCEYIDNKVATMARKYNITLSGNTEKMTKENLYKRLAKNDINLCISILDDSETLPLESLELGVACIIGNNYEYFIGTELENYLIVNKTDNIIEIYSKIQEVIQNKDKILALYEEWKVEYVKKAKECVEIFLKEVKI